MPNKQIDSISRMYLTWNTNRKLYKNVKIYVNVAKHQALSASIRRYFDEIYQNDEAARHFLTEIHISRHYMLLPDIQQALDAFDSLSEEQKNALFSDAMKEMDDSANAVVPPISDMETLNTSLESCRKKFPPLNLSDKEFQVFLLILGLLLQLLFDSLTSHEDEILANQQKEIAIQTEIREELRKFNASHSEDFSISPTDTTKETKP